MKHVWLWGAVGIALLGLSFSVLELSGHHGTLADEITRLRDRGFRRDIKIAELEADLKSFKERAAALPAAYQLILGSVRVGPVSADGAQTEAINSYVAKHGEITDPCLKRLFADVGLARMQARKKGIDLNEGQRVRFLQQAEECVK